MENIETIKQENVSKENNQTQKNGYFNHQSQFDSNKSKCNQTLKESRSSNLTVVKDKSFVKPQISPKNKTNNKSNITKSNSNNIVDSVIPSYIKNDSPCPNKTKPNQLNSIVKSNIVSDQKVKDNTIRSGSKSKIEYEPEILSNKIC